MNPGPMACAYHYVRHCTIHPPPEWVAVDAHTRSEMDIYEVVKPFYVLSRLVGFAWFPLPSYKWKLPKLADAVLMIANVSLRLCMVYWSLSVSNFTIARSMGLLVNQLFLLANPLVWLCTIAVGLCKRQESLAVLCGLAQFDKRFVHPVPSSRLNHTRHKRLLWVYICTLLAIDILTSVITYSTCKDLCKLDLTTLLVSVLSTIFYEVCVSHILLCTWAVLVRLRLLNAAFERDCKKHQLAIRRPDNMSSNVRYYRCLYELLYSTMEDINMCYAWFGLFCIVICFLAIMSTLFFTYEMAQVDPIFKPLFLPNVIWLVIFNSFLVAIVNINDKMKQEVWTNLWNSNQRWQIGILNFLH